MSCRVNRAVRGSCKEVPVLMLMTSLLLRIRCAGNCLLWRASLPNGKWNPSRPVCGGEAPVGRRKNGERKKHRPPSLGGSRWETADQPGGESAERQSAVVERREDFPMQKCTLENQVPKSDRPCSQCLLLWMRDLEWEPRNDGQDLTDGKRRFAEYY